MWKYIRVDYLHALMIWRSKRKIREQPVVLPKEIPQVMPTSLILCGSEICDVLRIVHVTRRGYSPEQWFQEQKEWDREKGLTYLHMGQWTPDLPIQQRALQADEGASSCSATEPTLYWHTVLMAKKDMVIPEWLWETWMSPPWISNV